ncbi:hypothetical protein [Acidimangrovimonas sediminis]|uniref:hypothetical protein n=1 Tax=Acidimangrovimonas sediminis TaxID=2056283 RepID=UPI000C809B19|nr:hypothetical protein [Acidimangrovimonas sediminis]
MSGRNKEKDLAVLDESVAKDLVKFSRGSKQRVVDFCNQDLANDDSEVLDEQKNYSSWNRALNCQEVWEGLIESLDDLWSSQIARPFDYIEEPGDDLRGYMKNFASADWWFDTLKPDMSPSTFRAWFSGRSASDKKIAALRERFDDWWTRMAAALDGARDYTKWAQAFRKDGPSGVFEIWEKDAKEPRRWNQRGLDQILYRLVVEDRVVTKAEARSLVEEKFKRYYCGRLTMIDPSDPKDPFAWLDWAGDYARETCLWEIEERLDEIFDNDFPLATPSLPPNGKWERVLSSEGQWGGFAEEEGTSVQNSELWGLWYRQETVQVWNRDSVGYESNESRILQVSEDGKHWREPDEREAQGWLSGTTAFLEALVQGKDTSSPYYQERELHRWAKRMAHDPSNLKYLLKRLKDAPDEIDERAKKRLEREVELVKQYL